MGKQALYELKGIIFKVFVVVTRHMSGVQDCGIFSNKAAADKHIKDNDIGGKAEVVEAEVFGELEKENHVFSAAHYDRSSDIHILDGVYGSYTLAKSAVGEKGLVLERILSL